MTHRFGNKGSWSRSRLSTASQILGQAVALLVMAVAANAQTFSLVSSTIETGSGQSTGDSFIADASVAPPAAGAMSGANYQAVAGPSTEPTPSAPPLLISFVAGGRSITIAWPKENALWRLRETPTLVGTQFQWTDITAPHLTNATHISITVSASLESRFYRLERP